MVQGIHVYVTHTTVTQVLLGAITFSVFSITFTTEIKKILHHKHETCPLVMCCSKHNIHQIYHLNVFQLLLYGSEKEYSKCLMVIV